MFECDRCGACCRNISNVKFLEKFNDGSGVCVKLDRENNLCTIYENRPVYCNVDSMYELFFADKMTRNEFYELNYNACRELKKACG